MASLSSIAASVRQSASDAAFEVKVLHEAGILGLSRPDTAAKLGARPSSAGAPRRRPGSRPRRSNTRTRRRSSTNAARSPSSRCTAAPTRSPTPSQKMGIGYGDGVGIMCRNHRGFIEATLAAAKLGASALYLNTMFAGPQLVEVTRREGPEGPRLRRGVRRPARRRSTRASSGSSAGPTATPTVPTLDSLIAANDDSNLKPPPDKPRFVILTSGTTGTPKGAQRSSPDGLLAMAAIIDKIPYRSRRDDDGRGAALPLLGLLPLRASACRPPRRSSCGAASTPRRR